MVALLDPTSLRPGGYLLIDNRLTGERTELDTFTCVHCSRVVVLNKNRTRARNTCRRCMRWTCDSAGCVAECNPVARDLERAFRDESGQPWLLRDNGHLIDRLFLPDGSAILVHRNDHGHTLAEATKGRRL